MFKSSKKLKSLLLACVLTITLVGSNFQVLVEASEPKDTSNVTTLSTNFKDVPKTHDFYSTITQLVNRGIVNGYGDGRFGPDDTITRAEVSVMLSKILQLNISKAQTKFSDVPTNHWAARHIAAVSSAGIVNGYANGRFGPNDNITRAELSVMVAKAFNLKIIEGNVKYFPDVSSTYWAKNYIDILVSNKVVNGYQNGYFGPGSITTRAQFTKFLVAGENAAKAAKELEAKSILYDKNGIKITYKGYEYTGDYYGHKLNLFIENNSDRLIDVQIREESINGYMVKGIISETVSAGKKAYTSIRFSNEDLERNFIESIKKVEFYFKIILDGFSSKHFKSDRITIDVN